MAEGERPRRRGLWIGVVAVVLGAVLATGGAEPGGAANQAVSGRVTIDGVGYAGIGVTTSGNSQTFTDATGTFHSTVINDPGSIEVDVDEWRTGVPMPIVTELWVFGVAFSAGPVDIDLPPPAALTVRVREEDGTPVSGATVFSNHSDLTGITHPGTRAQLHTQSNAETGASGDVTLEDMVGLTDVRVVHSVDGVHREVTIPDVPVTDGHELTVTLPETRPVTATVSIDGVGHNGADVWIESDDGVVSSFERTGATGTASLRAVPGPAVLHVRTVVTGAPDTGVLVELATEVEAHEDDTFALDLPVPASVTVDVTDTLGEPIPGNRHTYGDPTVQVTTTEVPPGATPPGEVTEFESSDAATVDEAGHAVLAAYPGAGSVSAHENTGHYLIEGIGQPWPPFERRTTLDDQTVDAGDHFDVELPALPGEPTDVTFALSDRHHALVSWSPPAEDVGTPITGYEVLVGDADLSNWRNPIPPGRVELEVDDDSVEIPVTPGVPLHLRLYALTAGGPGPEVEDVVTSPRLLPDAPAEAAFEAAPGQVSVDWSPPAADPGIPITGYEVITSTPNDFDVHTTSYGPEIGTATITGLTNARAVKVQVRARTEDGPGPSVSEVLTPRLVHRVDVRSVDGQSQVRGNDEYGTGPNDQVLFADLSKRGTGRYPFVIENDGSTSERMVVHDRTNAPGLRVRWFDGTREVTRAVEAGTYRTPVLAAGQNRRLVAVTRVTPGFPRGLVQVLTLEARPAQLLGQRDKVTYWVTVRR